MSELKVASCFEFEKVLTGKSNKLFYPKSEVDKLIAELEKERDWLAKDRAQAYDDLEKRAQLNIKQEESIRRQKYKRCVAKAEMCGAECDKWMMKKANAIGLGKDGVEYFLKARRKVSHYMGWQQRWLAIGERFKEAKCR